MMRFRFHRGEGYCEGLEDWYLSSWGRGGGKGEDSWEVNWQWALLHEHQSSEKSNCFC
jgi:hypothetical protein